MNNDTSTQSSSNSSLSTATAIATTTTLSPWFWQWYYINPIGAAICLTVNSINMFVFALMREGIGKSVRVYYLALAIFDFLGVFVYHLFEAFGAAGIFDPNFSVPACKALRYLWLASDHTVNWVYVAFCIEKLIAVTDPFKARTTCTPKRAMLNILVIALVGYSVWIIAAFYYTSFVVGGTASRTCGTDPALTQLGLVGNIMAVVDVYSLPNLTTFGLTLALVYQIRKQASDRKHMTAQASQEKSLSTSELASIVTLVAMTVLHCTFWLPAAVIRLLSTVYTLFFPNDTVSNLRIRTVFYVMLYLLTVPHSMNFFVYIFRLPQYRRTLFNPFSK